MKGIKQIINEASDLKNEVDEKGTHGPLFKRFLQELGKMPGVRKVEIDLSRLGVGAVLVFARWVEVQPRLTGEKSDLDMVVAIEDGRGNYISRREFEDKLDKFLTKSGLNFTIYEPTFKVVRGRHNEKKEALTGTPSFKIGITSYKYRA